MEYALLEDVLLPRMVVTSFWLDPLILRRIAMKTITTHYIDGAFVESHGREVMDIISPTNRKVIGRVTLGDEEDTRRAIAAAKRAFATFGRTTKEERAKILAPAAQGRLGAHRRSSGRDDRRVRRRRQVRPAYCGVGRQRVPGGREGTPRAAIDAKLGQDDSHPGAGRRCGLIKPWNANSLFICLKLASAVAAGCTVVIKPSEMSALQTQVMARVSVRGETSEGVFNVVTGLRQCRRR